MSVARWVGHWSVGRYICGSVGPPAGQRIGARVDIFRTNVEDRGTRSLLR